MKLEPETETRSIGINCDLELIEALDEIRAVMADDGEVPSRSEIARTILWTGVAMIRSRSPQVARLLKAAADAEDAWSSASVSEPAR